MDEAARRRWLLRRVLLAEGIARPKQLRPPPKKPARKRDEGER